MQAVRVLDRAHGDGHSSQALVALQDRCGKVSGSSGSRSITAIGELIETGRRSGRRELVIASSDDGHLDVGVCVKEPGRVLAIADRIVFSPHEP